jgi:hypothetical protein
MPDVQSRAENTPGLSRATYKASDQESEPDVSLQPATFQADVEGLESFEDEPRHAPSSPLPPPKPRPVKVPGAGAADPAPAVAKASGARASAAETPDKPRSRSFSVLWPSLLIAAGAVLLLSNMGYLPEILWSQLWRFWPVLLIAMGIDTLFSRRSVFGSIVGALLILTLLGGVIYVVAFAR